MKKNFTVKLVPSKPPTLREIARKAGLSAHAVSLALRSSPEVSAATRKRVEALAEEMGYQRNPATSELMRQMRLRGYHKQGAGFAVVNAHEDAEALREHPTIPAYMEGIRRRAEPGGYGLDVFWLHQWGTRTEKWFDVLHARNIRGLLIVGLMGRVDLPDFFHPVIRRYPCAVTGVRTRSPALSFACVDHHALTCQAVQEVLRRGYRRPGLVLDPVIDHLVMGRFTAGFEYGRQGLPSADRIPVYSNALHKPEVPKAFSAWYTRYRPDVILTLYNRARRWVQAVGDASEPGFVQLELRPDSLGWAGMHQHNDRVGEAAFELLVSALLNGETGDSAFVKGVLISPSWRDGASLPDREPLRREYP